MSARSLRSRLALAVGVAVLVTGSACSDETSPESSKSNSAAATLVAAAADRTSDAKSARVAVNVDAAFGEQTIKVIADGIVSLTRPKGRLELRVPDLLGDRRITAIVVGDSFYLRVPGLGAGDDFYEVNIADLSSGDNPFAQLGNTDPTAALELLRGVSSDVEEVGSETLRGETTTHYRGTLDVAKAIAAAPRGAREKVRNAFAKVESLPFDVYIDEAGRLRKMTLQLSVPEPPGDQGPATIAVAVELFDFGIPVKVTAPPKDQVVDGSGLLGLLGGGAQ